ncbi:MAG TPA: ElyC/SanA/YdcF family protein [Candidatus Obscuribacterales bacterium]
MVDVQSPQQRPAPVPPVRQPAPARPADGAPAGPATPAQAGPVQGGQETPTANRPGDGYQGQGTRQAAGFSPDQAGAEIGRQQQQRGTSLWDRVQGKGTPEEAASAVRMLLDNPILAERGSAAEISQLLLKVADGDELTPQQQKNLARVLDTVAGRGQLGQVTEALLDKDKFYAFYDKFGSEGKQRIAPIISANLPERFQLKQIEQLNQQTLAYLDQMVRDGNLGPRAQNREYPCDVIIVPGISADIPGDQPVTDLKTEGLTEDARKRLDTAIQDFREGKAPVIVVSGGCVHPESTRVSEALAMRDYLLSKNIPADRILVEGQARHTTTNLRNVGRMMADHGLTRGLVVSDETPRPLITTSQTFYLGSPFFTSAYQAAYGHDGPGVIKDESPTMGLPEAELTRWRHEHIGKSFGGDNTLGVGDKRKLFFPSAPIVRQPGGEIVDPLDP